MKKSEFIAEKLQVIKVKKIVIDTLNSIIPTIEKFDNKVYNKRLITAFQKVSPNKDISFVIKNDKVELYCNNDLRMFYDEQGRYLGYISRDIEWLYIHFNKEGKIDGTETINVANNVISRLNNEIMEYQNCIADYDTYMALNDDIIKAIKNYRDKVPNSLRLNITYSSPF